MCFVVSLNLALHRGSTHMAEVVRADLFRSQPAVAPKPDQRQLENWGDLRRAALLITRPPRQTASSPVRRCLWSREFPKPADVLPFWPACSGRRSLISSGFNRRSGSCGRSSHPCGQLQSPDCGSEKTIASQLERFCRPCWRSPVFSPR